MLVKFSFVHSQRGLFPGSAQNELPARLVHAIGKILQRLQASGIYGGHIPEPKNDDGR